MTRPAISEHAVYVEGGDISPAVSRTLAEMLHGCSLFARLETCSWLDQVIRDGTVISTLDDVPGDLLHLLDTGSYTGGGPYIPTQDSRPGDLGNMGGTASNEDDPADPFSDDDNTDDPDDPDGAGGPDPTTLTDDDSGENAGDVAVDDAEDDEST